MPTPLSTPPPARLTPWHQIADTEREVVARQVIDELLKPWHHDIPEHLRPGLIRYFSHGILPGGFLQAVLCNDLTQTVCRAADLSTLDALAPLIRILLDHAPALAWGSREAVLAWSTTPDQLEIDEHPRVRGGQL